MQGGRRITVHGYLLLFCLFYVTSLVYFYIYLQQETDFTQLGLLSSNSEVTQETEENCMVSKEIKSQFQALDSKTFVFSAYLDHRYEKKEVRIMALMDADKYNRNITFLCAFRGRDRVIIVKGRVYELCENHSYLYGGYIVSCVVPTLVVSTCSINITIESVSFSKEYKLEPSKRVIISVTKLQNKILDNWFIERRKSQSEADWPFRLSINDTSASFMKPSANTWRRKEIIQASLPYNYTICVPPLFGDIKPVRLIEFIELNRLLGFQHFIFYLYNITNTETVSILNYYAENGLMTTVRWNLPPSFKRSTIWYNGQISAHNDCLYRAMAMSKYLAIIDLDEFIVPHNGDSKITNIVENLFSEKVGGLVFKSATFDPRYNKGKDKLQTLALTHRSSDFSDRRTKVLVQPKRVFEVGIHHISKLTSDWLKVVKVNQSKAFLHHYRECYSRRREVCDKVAKDNTTQKYKLDLMKNVKAVQKRALNKPYPDR